MDELQASVQRRLYRLRDLTDGLTGLRAEHTSQDGEVTVVVDGNGGLLDLRFTEDISRMTPSEFEQTLTGTAAAAVREVFAQRAELVTAFNAEVAG
ncbi:YbaB/EbfC family nucleoid-associated protein [Nocardia sp. NPDC058705]|uniref:YbaB/EbfC family nucleoid-associated protein n=1 Tax=Nocardia sp. NPDC058705 TaxID=3346609 RepID=UPI0036AD3FCE